MHSPLPHNDVPASIDDGNAAVVGTGAFEMPHGLRQNVLQLCKILSDPMRLRVVYYLSREPELNVTQLCQRVEQSQPAVSHHLAMMRTAGLVASRRSGRQIFYSLRNQTVQQTMTQLFLSFTPSSLN
jgi:DNA-binding transcriptional ArsR family regulator